MSNGVAIMANSRRDSKRGRGHRRRRGLELVVAGPHGALPAALKDEVENQQLTISNDEDIAFEKAATSPETHKRILEWRLAEANAKLREQDRQRRTSKRMLATNNSKRSRESEMRKRVVHEEEVRLRIGKNAEHPLAPNWTRTQMARHLSKITFKDPLTGERFNVSYDTLLKKKGWLITRKQTA